MVCTKLPCVFGLFIDVLDSQPIVEVQTHILPLAVWELCLGGLAGSL